MSYQALGKFKVITGDLPTIPHKCAGCGAWTGTFIDTGLDIEFYGEVYICTNCFTEMANQIEYYSPTQFKATEQIALDLQVRNYDLEGEIEELKNVLGSYNRLFPNHISSSESDLVSVVRETEESEDSDESNDSDSDGEEGSDESDDESGSSDISGNDDDELNKLLADI